MPCILKSKNKESQFNRPISQSISWSVRQSICQSVSRKELQCRALYLFAANQKAIQKKSISFSVSFVGMNFTKDSLCNVNRLKYNSLNIFKGDLIFRKTKSVYLNLVDMNCKKKKQTSDMFVNAPTFHHFCAGL